MSDESYINPHAPLGIIALSSCAALGESVSRHIRRIREKEDIECPETFLIPVNETRFSNGEGKVSLTKSVRGLDVFIMCDPFNYSCSYDLHGFTNHKGPDEHFQDLKRALSAICGKAKRMTVIIPRLYGARQDKRKGRESLDCALALQELERMGVKDIIAFDLHDSRVQNAVPLCSFENLHATYEIVKSIMQDERDIVIDNGNLLVISPDTGDMDRAIYYSDVLDAEVSMFYKRRDLSRLVNGKHPIVQHDYIGQPVEGKNVIVTDEEISAGDTILSVARELKSRKAKKVLIAATFTLFTEDCVKFTEAYNDGIIDRVYSTNLTYVPEKIKEMEWFREVDMSEYLAAVINRLNYNMSIAPLIDATNALRERLQKLRAL